MCGCVLCAFHKFQSTIKAKNILFQQGEPVKCCVNATWVKGIIQTPTNITNLHKFTLLHTILIFINISFILSTTLQHCTWCFMSSLAPFGKPFGKTTKVPEALLMPPFRLPSNSRRREETGWPGSQGTGWPQKFASLVTVVFHQPMTWKIYAQFGQIGTIFPKVEVKMKEHVWNHHQVHSLRTWNRSKFFL